VDFVDAWVGVVGTLLGAVVGGGLTFVIERDRRRHDSRHRFVDVKRILYGEYYGSTHRAGLQAVQRMHELHDIYEQRRSAPPDPIPDLAEIFRHYETIVLIAPEHVEVAANHLMVATADFVRLSAMDPTGLTEDPWKRGDANAMWDSHEKFLHLARRDLGIDA
jgi:hypothetical protein